MRLDGIVSMRKDRTVGVDRSLWLAGAARAVHQQRYIVGRRWRQHVAVIYRLKRSQGPVRNFFNYANVPADPSKCLAEHSGILGFNKDNLAVHGVQHVG